MDGHFLWVKTHHMKSKRSRKRYGAFLIATAFCKGSESDGKFQFVIDNEPYTEENINVDCTVSGRIRHSDDEVNRRNITGKERQLLGQDTRKTSASKVYYENSGDMAQMIQGNYTCEPNQTVLRKFVSKVIKKERLHSNILAELQVLKESYDKSHEPYIREIGYDPFYLIMFSNRQMEVSVEDNLCIYLDATGSVISNIVGQKPILILFSSETKR